MTDWIFLERMTFPCSIGIFAREREERQPLRFSVSLGLDLEPAGNDDFERTVDYAAVLSEVRFIAEGAHFALLESLALALLRWLLWPACDGEPRAERQIARVRIEKPRALGGAAIPSVEIERPRSWVTRGRPDDLRPLSLVHQTPSAQVWRMELAPGEALSFEDVPSRLPSATRFLVVCGAAQMASKEIARGEIIGGLPSRVANARATNDDGATPLVMLGVSRLDESPGGGAED